MRLMRCLVVSFLCDCHSLDAVDPVTWESGFQTCSNGILGRGPGCSAGWVTCCNCVESYSTGWFAL